MLGRHLHMNKFRIERHVILLVWTELPLTPALSQMPVIPDYSTIGFKDIIVTLDDAVAVILINRPNQ